MDFLATSPIPWLPAEIAYLALGLVLFAVHLNLQSILMTRELGADYNTSARDEQRKVTGVAARAERALRNFNETFPAFVALALAIQVMGVADWWTGFGAALWFWSRVVYLPLYLQGVPRWRSLVFILSAVGLIIMFAGLVSPASPS
jgi:uncharacterized MAPEG superfamily protein